MAVKRYDGSAWQVVAGKGDQGTSSSISTWVKTASGGETSLSGNDDNSQALSYTIGQELVFINGTLLKRGSDYTATNGTSITGLTALAANDVATVWTVNAFSVTGAIANTIVDAKGDLLVGTAADTPGRLAVGTNGQVLTADSTTGTGLKWAAVAAGGKVLQVVTATYSTQISSTSTTYADTGLTASITPSSTSSKVLVLVSQGIWVARNSTGSGVFAQLQRNGTAIQTVWQQAEAAQPGGNPVVIATQLPYIKLDSPSSTSSVTYKTQFKLSAANAGWSAEANYQTDSNIVLLEIGA